MLVTISLSLMAKLNDKTNQYTVEERIQAKLACEALNGQKRVFRKCVERELKKQGEVKASQNTATVQTSAPSLVPETLIITK